MLGGEIVNQISEGFAKRTHTLSEKAVEQTEHNYVFSSCSATELLLCHHIIHINNHHTNDLHFL